MDNLSNTLVKLDCSGNKIKSLDNLPSKLVYLYCQYNLLESLDNLPNTLVELCCFNDKINEEKTKRKISICENS